MVIPKEILKEAMLENYRKKREGKSLTFPGETEEELKESMKCFMSKKDFERAENLGHFKAKEN